MSPLGARLLISYEDALIEDSAIKVGEILEAHEKPTG